MEFMKQLPGGVTFCKLHREVPVVEPLFEQSCWPPACDLIKKETTVQMFTCEFRKIHKI